MVFFILKEPRPPPPESLLLNLFPCIRSVVDIISGVDDDCGVSTYYNLIIGCVEILNNWNFF